MNAQHHSSGLFALLPLLVVLACVAIVGCEQRYKPANYRAAPRAEAGSNEAAAPPKRQANVPLPRVTDWTSPSSIGEFKGGYSGGAMSPYRGGGYRGDIYRGYRNAGSAYRGYSGRGSAYRGYGNGTSAYRGFDNRYGAGNASAYRGYGKPASDYGDSTYRGYQSATPSNYRGYQKNPLRD